jgi:hypothetical protein
MTTAAALLQPHVALAGQQGQRAAGHLVVQAARLLAGIDHCIGVARQGPALAVNRPAGTFYDPTLKVSRRRAKS